MKIFLIKSKNKYIMSQKKYYNENALHFEKGLFFDRINRNHIKKIKKIEELLNLREEDLTNYHLLEVGVGTGIHAEYILKKYPDIDYIGVDISEVMIEQAREKLAKINAKKFPSFVVADGERLPFKDNYFDAAYISGSLHHFPHPDSGLRELLRVVKSGGRVILMEPNWLFPNNLFAAITNRVECNILKMNRRNFREWFSQSDIDNLIINNYIYTPPIPAKLTRIYDRIDDLLSNIPIISHFSIMIYASVQKRSCEEIENEGRIL